ncbi:MAG: hypothetical protein ACPLOV_01735 [Thermovenabulum sp.]
MCKKGLSLSHPLVRRFKNISSPSFKKTKDEGMAKLLELKPNLKLDLNKLKRVV